MHRLQKDAKTDVTDNLSPKLRLLAESAKIFGKKGFSATSVREICHAANTSSNMIHHYFGSKQGLYDAVLDRFSENVFDVPVRLIATVPESRDGFATRLEMFFEESLVALIENRHIYEMAQRERLIVPSFDDYNRSLITFLEAGKKLGIVRADLDSEMLTGMFLDRLGPQLFYADQVKEMLGESLLDNGPYRRRWMKANLDLFLNGIVTPS